MGRWHGEYDEQSVETHGAMHDSLSSHPRPGGRSWRHAPTVIVAFLTVVLVATVLVASSTTRESDWPTQCGVDGHPNWCARPSAAIADVSIVTLVHTYCPSLSDTLVGEVVPQPLSQLDLADENTLARTSGSAGNGSEEVLLGGPGSFSWVTRWVGGEQDGLWEVRCPGDARTTPSLRLEADHLKSTVAASQSAEGRHVDFGDVAKQLVAFMPKGRAPDVSFGFLECDTGSVELTRPKVGDTFSCAVEVYSQLGKGVRRAGYQVISRTPYFEPDDS